MTDSLETYRTVLRHIVRPDDPAEGVDLHAL